MDWAVTAWESSGEWVHIHVAAKQGGARGILSGPRADSNYQWQQADERFTLWTPFFMVFWNPKLPMISIDGFSGFAFTAEQAEEFFTALGIPQPPARAPKCPEHHTALIARSPSEWECEACREATAPEAAHA